MTNLEKELEALNESQVDDFIIAVYDDLDCARSCESVGDLRANLSEAIVNAEKLIQELKNLLQVSK